MDIPTLIVTLCVLGVMSGGIILLALYFNERIKFVERQLNRLLYPGLNSSSSRAKGECTIQYFDKEGTRHAG